MRYIPVILLCLLIGCKAKEAPVSEAAILQIAGYDPEEFSMEELMGKFEPERDSSFIELDEIHCSGPGMYLHKEAYAFFQEMFNAAQADGVDLKIISATRNFYHQKRIWENKWTGKTIVEDGRNLAESVLDTNERALVILKFSSMPGTSRHHWGTDIDLNSWSNEYFMKGKGLNEYNWLNKNAHRYGFCQPYTALDEDRPYGYNLEKWHWSYMPRAKKLTWFARKNLRDNMITGFMGSGTAEKISVVSKYVLGVNERCIQ